MLALALILLALAVLLIQAALTGKPIGDLLRAFPGIDMSKAPTFSTKREGNDDA